MPSTLPPASSFIPGQPAFRKILVAYDFSPLANLALEYALDLAVRQNSQLTIARVDAVEAASSAAVSEPEAALRERLLQRLTTYSNGPINFEIVARAGEPVGVLTDLVGSLDPDLLFLGANASAQVGLPESLGSTAEWFLRSLPCPTVILGPRAVRRARDQSQPPVMICPVDFPEDIEDRLKIIGQFARTLGAEVQFVHAVDVAQEFSRPHSAIDTQFEFDLLAGQLLRHGVSAQATLLYGDPQSVIIQHAREKNADYILFGLHKQGSFSSYFRKSLVAGVIRQAPCAIFTFPQVVRPFSRAKRIARPFVRPETMLSDQFARGGCFS